MDVSHQLIGIGGDDCKSPNPFARKRLLPVLPDAGDAEWRAVLHSDSVGLFCLLPLDRLPLEEAVHRHNAAAPAVRISKRRQISHGLVFGVDRLSTTCWVLAPIRDQAPAQRVERYLAGLVIAADDQQFLTRRSVPPGRIIVHASVAHVHAIDAGITKRSAALDDPPTHGSHIVIHQHWPTHGPLYCIRLARCLEPHVIWSPREGWAAP